MWRSQQIFACQRAQYSVTLLCHAVGISLLRASPERCLRHDRPRSLSPWKDLSAHVGPERFLRNDRPTCSVTLEGSLCSARPQGDACPYRGDRHDRRAALSLRRSLSALLQPQRDAAHHGMGRSPSLRGRQHDRSNSQIVSRQ